LELPPTLFALSEKFRRSEKFRLAVGMKEVVTVEQVEGVFVWCSRAVM
jgi:hypothetical protein